MTVAEEPPVGSWWAEWGKPAVIAIVTAAVLYALILVVLAVA